MAVTAAGAAAIVLTAGVLTACGSRPASPSSASPPPPSVITLSDAQIARIKG